MTSDNSTVEISDPEMLVAAPLVSVYMLAYRHERFIHEAIEGVLAQQCDFPIELIIGEDCSPDRTRDIALAYQERYPQLIRILASEKNVGAYANARRCMLAARGKYVAICEGDDYWTHPAKLATQVALLEAAPDISLVCHSVQLVDQAPRGSPKNGIHRIGYRSRRLSRKEVVLGDGALIPTCSMMVRSDVLRARPSWWESCAIGDYPLALRASQLGDIAYLDRPMGAYRINVEGSWTSSHRNTIERRSEHAESISTMLLGFLSDDHDNLAGAVATVRSKYFFDAIIRSSATAEQRRALFALKTPAMTFADNAVARISLRAGRNFGWVRTIWKIPSARLRHLWNDLAMQKKAGGMCG